MKPRLANWQQPSPEVPRWRCVRFCCLGLSALLFLSGLSGCVKLNRTIELNSDGSGRLIEEVEIEEQAFEMAREDAAALEDFLKEERIKERIRAWGDVTFVSYKPLERGGKLRGAKTVLSFKSIDKIAVPALPTRGSNWPVQMIRFSTEEPTTQDGGYMQMHRYHRLPILVKFDPAVADIEPRKNPKPPIEQEQLRRLLPALRSMMGNFQVSFELKAFCPLDEAVTCTLFNVRAADLADDDTLIKVIEWNRFPDELLAVGKLNDPKGVIGREDGTLLLKDTRISLGYPTPTNQADAARITKMGTPEPAKAPERAAPKDQSKPQRGAERGK